VKRNIIVFLTGAAVIIALDQITKAAIMANFTLHESRSVINGFFNLVYVMNPGAAFSFLADAPAAFRSVFFFSVTALAVVLIIYYLVKSKPESLLIVTSLSLIFAGAVGNVIDRLRFGSVIDFLDVYAGAWHWPAFNVADSAISIGAALMIWEMIISRKQEKPS